MTGSEAPANEGSRKGPIGRRSGDAETRGASNASATLRMLADAPVGLSGDQLKYEDYAEALAGLVHNPRTATPLTLAINAPWGAGKSSLARMMQEKLQEKASVSEAERHVVCEFNAWMHDDAGESLGAAFTCAVAKTANEHRSLWRRIVNPLPSGLRDRSTRIAWRAGMVLLALLASACLTTLALYVASDKGAPSDAKDPFVTSVQKGDVGGIAGHLPSRFAGLFTGLSLLLLILGYVFRAAGAVEKFVNEPAEQARSGAMDRVRSQLGKLIRQATRGKRRFVVFIDDLERCRPPGGVDVLEIANQLLSHEGVIVVVMADVPALAATVEIKYAELAKKHAASEGLNETQASHRFGVLYLQKIIQLQFDLPEQSPERMHALLHDMADVTKAPPAASAPTAAPPERSVFHALTEPLFSPSAFVLREGRVFGEPIAKARGLRVEQRALVWLVFAATLPNRAALRAFRGVLVTREPEPRARRWLVGIVVLYPWLFTFYAFMLILLLPLLPILVPFGDIPWVSDATLTIYIALFVGALVVIPLVQRQYSRMVKEYAAQYDAYLRGERAPRVDSGSLDAATKRAVERERTQVFLANDSPLMEEASREVIAHHPAAPRNAKRLLNRLRLLLFIAHAREMLREGDPLQPRHIGKWAVLQERWPDVAQAVIRDPSRMEQLEAWAAQAALASSGKDAFRVALGQLVSIQAPDDSLADFLGRPPFLREHVRRLVAFEPAKRLDVDGPPAKTAPTATLQ